MTVLLVCADEQRLNQLRTTSGISLWAMAGLIALSPLAMWSSSSDQSWKNVEQTNHRAKLIFLERNGNCTGGEIKRVDGSSVTVLKPNKSEVTIPQSDLVRITTGQWAPGVIYTTRSSWLDVMNLVGRNFHPTVSIESKNGQERKGKLLSASAGEIVLKSSGKQAVITKDEIASVTYVRERPLSSSAEYADDELAFLTIFDPELWPHMLHLEGTFAIRLYDSSLPEDDSPLVCKTPAWPLVEGKPELTTPPLR